MTRGVVENWHQTSVTHTPGSNLGLMAMLIEGAREFAVYSSVGDDCFILLCRFKTFSNWQREVK